ncbi:mycothiol transferase [Cellulomonas biazotea]|uniref:Chorismate synthase n=1 Tax=Cellulomonas biazotea TaxID=1709 RepID=A0A402DRS0_9CELL|nr:DUF664 domain-containing protein [Cellulomonas biazotea]GCE76817.1 hypothetical protein CBZ_18730 [Cellulomonas biazotea]
MDVADLLVEALGRVGPVLRSAVRDLDRDGLTFRPDPGANSIAWLAWHAARGQDAQVADLAGVEQVWTARGWSQRFGLPFAAGATGYGQSTQDVALVDVPAELLLGYYDDVAAQTVAYLQRLEPGDLDRVVDESWDPPVTLGVRLVSVVDDDVQHAGQAAYVRGLWDRSR